MTSTSRPKRFLSPEQKYDLPRGSLSQGIRVPVWERAVGRLQGVLQLPLGRADT